jgi:hypothetical protein
MTKNCFSRKENDMTLIIPKRGSECFPVHVDNIFDTIKRRKQKRVFFPAGKLNMSLKQELYFELLVYN